MSLAVSGGLAGLGYMASTPSLQAATSRFVHPITEPTDDFSKAERYEAMAGGAGTFTGTAERNAFSQTPQGPAPPDLTEFEKKHRHPTFVKSVFQSNLFHVFYIFFLFITISNAKSLVHKSLGLSNSFAINPFNPNRLHIQSCLSLESITDTNYNQIYPYLTINFFNLL